MGCLIIILLGILGTFAALAEGNSDLAFAGFIFFLFIPIAAVLIHLSERSRS